VVFEATYGHVGGPSRGSAECTEVGGAGESCTSGSMAAGEAPPALFLREPDVAVGADRDAGGLDVAGEGAGHGDGEGGKGAGQRLEAPDGVVADVGEPEVAVRALTMAFGENLGAPPAPGWGRSHPPASRGQRSVAAMKGGRLRRRWRWCHPLRSRRDSRRNRTRYRAETGEGGRRRELGEGPPVSHAADGPRLLES